MGQAKIYINISKQLLIGVDYDKGFCFQLHVLFFTFGIGLTDSAKGFDFWFK